MGAELEKKQFYMVTSIIAGGLLLSLYLHLIQYWSPLQLPENVWSDKINFHLTYPPFAIRPINTYAVLLVKYLFGFSIKVSFFILQYLLYIISAFAFYKFLLLVFGERRDAYTGLIFYVLSFPVLCAHFEPLFTWNDLWLYLFIILIFYNLVKEKYYPVSIFLLAALLAHEQSIIFVPLICLRIYQIHKHKSIKHILPILISVTLYMVYRIILWEDIASERWSLLIYNFENSQRTLGSLVSLFNTYGIFWILSIIGFLSIIKFKDNPLLKLLNNGFIFILPLNLLIVFCFAFARETRLFFVTFIFVLPLAVIGLKKFLSYVNFKKNKFVFIILIPLFILTTIIVTQNYYLDYFYKANAEVRTLFLGIHLGLAEFLLVSTLFGYLFKSRNSRLVKVAAGTSITIVFFAIFYQVAWPVLKGPIESKNLISNKLNFNENVSLVEVKSLKVKNRIIEIDFTLEIKDTIEDDYLVVWYLKQKNGKEVYSRKFTPNPQFSSLKPIDTVTFKRFDDFPKGELQLVFDIYNEKGHLGWPVTAQINLK